MYTTQFEGGPQAVGCGVGEASGADVAGALVPVASVVGEASGADVAGALVPVASVVGEAVGATVTALLVSVAGIAGEAGTVGEGVTVNTRTTTGVGDGATSAVSS